MVRLEGRSLRIPEAGYFNSGVEVRRSLVLADLWADADSPIGGGAVGWLRSLADSPLPFAKQIDALLTSLQAGGTAVRITGTASDPDIRQTPLKELQSLLGRALGAGG